MSDSDASLGLSDSPEPRNDSDSFDDDDFPEPILFSDDESGDDDLGDNFDFRETLKAASGFKLRKKPTLKLYARRRMMKDANRDLDPEVRDYLARANEAFAKNDLTAAWNNYMEVIKRDGKNFNAYNTLGEICEMQGKMNQCCSYRLIAAEIRPWDGHLWGHVAELSAELGHIDQAIYCYNHAIAAKHLGNNPRHIVARLQLYKKKQQFGRALEGFQRLHRMFPRDPQYVKNIAMIYVDQKRFNDAVSLYTRILEQNMREEKPETPLCPVFTWLELNILCELYIGQHAWRDGIRAIKVVARWMQHRQKETFFDSQDDDSEFDERREKLCVRAKADPNKDHSLPIDIRYKLGFFRLQINQKEEAVTHFRHLFLQDTGDVVDLYVEAARSLADHSCYEEALPFLEELLRADNYPEVEVETLLGKCYLETKDYERAKETLLKVLQIEDNADIRIGLFEAFFFTGDQDNARQIVAGITAKTPQVEAVEEQLLSNDHLALIRNTLYPKNQTRKLTDEERLEIEKSATKMVLDRYSRMERLRESVEQGNRVAFVAWTKLASQLIEMFMGIRSFFPRTKRLLRAHALGLDDHLARLYNLCEGLTENDNAKVDLSISEFRGLSISQWVCIFVDYALLHKRFDINLDDAMEVLDVALEASIFSQDKSRSMVLKLTKIGLGIHHEDYGVVSTNVRTFLALSQFSPTLYTFFMCCFGSGMLAWAAFSNYNHQKYFLRHVKAFDQLLTSSKISGAAQITANTDNLSLTREHPHLLYIYASLLGSNRAFSSPIVYLRRAHSEYYNDPTICFMLALAHIHRSMQRNSHNRHLQLLQGFSYLLEYRENRRANATDYELQEIEYNFGRVFHMLGLFSLAVEHYDKVLLFHGKVETDFDMLVEAAYNLTLIYTITGNSQKARLLVETYLVI